MDLMPAWRLPGRQKRSHSFVPHNRVLFAHIAGRHIVIQYLYPEDMIKMATCLALMSVSCSSRAVTVKRSFTAENC